MIKLLKSRWSESPNPLKYSLIVSVGLAGIAVGFLCRKPEIQTAEDKIDLYRERLDEEAATILELESDRDRIKTTLCAELRGRHAECKDPFPTSLSLLKLLTTCAATGACPHAGRLKGNE